MERRLQALSALGIPTEFHHYPGLRHGFGLGTGTVAGGVAGPGGGLLGGQHQPKHPPDVTAAGASRQKPLSPQPATPCLLGGGPLWGLRLSLWVAGGNHCKPLGKVSITNGNFTNPLGVLY